MKNRLIIYTAAIVFVFTTVQCARENIEYAVTNSEPEVVYIQNNLKDSEMLSMDRVDGRKRFSEVRKDGSIFQYLVSNEFPSDKEAENALQKLSEGLGMDNEMNDPDFDGKFEDPEAQEAFDLLGDMFGEVLHAIDEDREKRK